MKNIIIILSHLATLLKKNIQLVDAFTILEDLIQNAKWHAIIKNIKTELQHGSALDKTFAKNIPNMPAFILNLISIGEITNQRSKCLKIAAKYLQTKIKLRKKIIQKLIYPSITITTALLIIILMQHLIIPNILDFYNNIDILPPVSIKIFIKIINLGELFSVILLILIFILFLYKNQNYKITTIYRNILYKTPVLRHFINLNFCYNCCLNFKMLLAAHQAIPDILEHLSTQNFWPQHLAIINDWKKKFSNGLKLSIALQKTSSIPHFMHTHIAIAEQSGEMLECFTYLTQYFETEITELFSSLNRWLEPLIVLSLGLIIGIICACIYYPIFQISSSL